MKNISQKVREKEKNAKEEYKKNEAENSFSNIIKIISFIINLEFLPKADALVSVRSIF